jgi:hypothetical protein
MTFSDKQIEKTACKIRKKVNVVKVHMLACQIKLHQIKYFVDGQILGLCHDFLYELSRNTNSQGKLKKKKDE